jgi:hypothetical protein
MLSLLYSLILIGFSTTFSEVDRFNPDPNLACLSRHLRKGEAVAAHRTLPCGTKLFLHNPRTGLATSTIVLDRGPYGKWKSGKDKGKYKAELDITPSVAKALKHNGFEPIIIIPMGEEPNWQKTWQKRKRAPNS